MPYHAALLHCCCCSADVSGVVSGGFSGVVVAVAGAVAVAFAVAVAVVVVVIVVVLLLLWLWLWLSLLLLLWLLLLLARLSSLDSGHVITIPLVYLLGRGPRPPDRDGLSFEGTLYYESGRLPARS